MVSGVHVPLVSGKAPAGQKGTPPPPQLAAGRGWDWGSLDILWSGKGAGALEPQMEPVLRVSAASTGISWGESQEVQLGQHPGSGFPDVALLPAPSILVPPGGGPLAFRSGVCGCSSRAPWAEGGLGRAGAPVPGGEGRVLSKQRGLLPPQETVIITVAISASSEAVDGVFKHCLCVSVHQTQRPGKT